MTKPEVYKPKNKIRVVTAASLFDGHDAAINIMRRIIQSSGAEVIHLGHDRSVQEVVDCAIQEDAQAIAMTSYQGGHMEYFKYMFDLLKEKGCSHIKIFGGGGGVILPVEIEELQQYGIARIYSPDDGRAMGLQGMINDMLQQCDFPTGVHLNGEVKELKKRNPHAIATLISGAENFPEQSKLLLDQVHQLSKKYKTPVLGITGTGGAGKSSLVDELVRRFLIDFKEKTIAIISVDPSKRKTGGALLGDRIRMNSIRNERVFMRSLATRQSNLALSKYVKEAIDIIKAAQFDLIMLETSGIGQSDTEIIEHSDLSLYVMTPEYGAASQLEKIDMLDFADIIALNKFDKRGALDAIRDVKKQYKRNHQLWEVDDEDIPVFGTIASQFNDPGMNRLYKSVMDKISEKTGAALQPHLDITKEMSEKIYIIPPARTRYLSEISENNRKYDQWVVQQSDVAQKLFALNTSRNIFETTSESTGEKTTAIAYVNAHYSNLELLLDGQNRKLLEGWEEKCKNYRDEFYVYKVRGKDIKVKTHTESLSHSQITKVATPKFEAWGEILKWVLKENFPGEFPYTAGIYPFKREGEDPTRMFAGEGGPERTNKRFHYVSLGLPAKRLSTAFDSVTLYGQDPEYRPDIYGKIGNSGVSICCLDDAKKLYRGFNLADAKTSVSMTITGPAAIITGFFMNAAIDQQC
ncbi:MAG: methylmalonyl-CoA mutase family protein, partial [Chitinophagales bacterium]